MVMSHQLQRRSKPKCRKEPVTDITLAHMLSTSYQQSYQEHEDPGKHYLFLFQSRRENVAEQYIDQGSNGTAGDFELVFLVLADLGCELGFEIGDTFLVGGHVLILALVFHGGGYGGD
jgi:hypothetical protein